MVSMRLPLSRLLQRLALPHAAHTARRCALRSHGYWGSIKGEVCGRKTDGTVRLAPESGGSSSKLCIGVEFPSSDRSRAVTCSHGLSLRQTPQTALTSRLGLGRVTSA
jgi:hypothetical protein